MHACPYQLQISCCLSLHRDCLALLQGHTTLVGQLQLRDSVLVTGGSDGRVIVFSLSTLECLHRLCAHDNSVTCLQFDDRFLVTGGNDGRVKLFDFKTGQFIRELAEPCEAVWRITFREDKVVIMCRRQGRTVSDSFTPARQAGHCRQLNTMFLAFSHRPCLFSHSDQMKQSSRHIRCLLLRRRTDRRDQRVQRACRQHLRL